MTSIDEHLAALRGPEVPAYRQELNALLDEHGIWPKTAAARDAFHAYAENLLTRAARNGRNELSAGETDALEIAAAARKAAEDVLRADKIQEDYRASLRDGHGEDRRVVNPLDFPASVVENLHAALRSGEAFRWNAEPIEQRATVTTALYGTTTQWAAWGIQTPVLLHTLCGVPSISMVGIKAQFPQWVEPTASTSVGEGVTVTEYDDSTPVTVTAARFGRFTDISAEAELNGTAELLQKHRAAIARDLNTAFVTAVATGANAVSYTTSAAQTLRLAIATAADAAAVEPRNVAALVSLADFAAITDTTAPANGTDLGGGFPRFAGALLVPSSSVATGTAYASSFGTAFRYFEAMAPRVWTQIAPKTGITTAATQTIGGYGSSSDVVYAADLTSD